MIIPPGYFHVVHVFGGPAAPQGGAVTYGIEDNASLTGTEIAEALHETFHDAWGAEAAVGWVLERTLVKAGPNVTGPTYEYAESLAGTQVGAAAPPNTAVLVRKRTVLGGRMNRGRFYWPGPTEDAIGNAGEVTAGYLSLYQASATSFLGDLAALDLPMVLLHSASSDPTMVTSLTVDAQAATQRRRLR